MSENHPPALEHDDSSSIDRAPMPAPARNRVLLVVMGGIVVAVLLYQVFSTPEKAPETGPRVAANSEEAFRPTPRQPSAPIFEIRPPVAGNLPTATPTAAMTPLPITPPSQPVAAAVDEEDFNARRRAPLLITAMSALGGSGSATPTATAAVVAPASARPSRNTSAPESHLDFLERMEGAPPVVTSTAYSTRQLEYRIFEGKLISGVMETAISSDLPGQVRAMVDEDVYGEKGRVILLPRMTRLVGEYSSTVKSGQTRILIVWRRAIRPDGVGITLASPGTDGIGLAGMTGEVNNHFAQRFTTAALVTIMGGIVDVAVARASQKGNGGINNATIVVNTQTASTVGKEFVDLTKDITRDMAEQKPTITVPQGASLKVFVTRDLDFSTILPGGSGQ